MFNRDKKKLRYNIRFTRSETLSRVKLVTKNNLGSLDKNHESKNLPEERLFENLFQDQFVFVLNNLEILHLNQH